MSEQQASWNNSHIEDLSGGTLSSQDTLCSQENTVSGFGNLSHNAGGLFQDGAQGSEDVSLSHADTASFQVSEHFQGNNCQNTTTALESSGQMFSISNPPLLINEDTQMFGAEVPSTMESPYDVTSPGCEPGDISSPFEAMESDGLNDPDDSMFSTSSTMRRPFRTTWPQETFSTTTPGGSSDEDPYASSGSRKKRRRTKKDMHPSINFTQDHFQHYSPNSQIPSPVLTSDAVGDGNDPNNILQGFLGRPRGNSQIAVNNSDSNLFNTILKANRRLSNASESNQSSVCTRENNVSVVDSSMNSSIASGMVENEISIGNEHRRPHYKKPLSLQAVYPSSNHGCSLHILVQPEEQHRARYLTEGSRGPVKDSSQQAYPQIQLKGYTGKTTLSVYVGSDSDDKVRPHGFYQACKVTGRNTTPCEESEIEGTKVILIPFDAQEILSVDCVGILKLRNADVELRIGANRAKKRSQTVRLVFRIALEDLPGYDKQNPCILQVVSNRINCTQPRGQPEITKKSLERCPVEGKQEMFIIGRNFHKGTRVIFQDTEEPDGSHWHTAGAIDKDTFNQSHLVVHIPPYHDQTITKPVNVQLCVEYNGRKCDPHSFTYDPSPTLAQKEVTPEPEVAKEPAEDALKHILDSSKIDRKVLEALFARLLRPAASDVETADVKPVVEEHRTSEPVKVTPVVAQMDQVTTMQPALFTTDNHALPSSVQRPVPVPSAINAPVTSRVIIKPNIFGSSSAAFSGVSSLAANPVVFTSQPFKPLQTPITTSGQPINQSISVGGFVTGQPQQGSIPTSMSAMTYGIVTGGNTSINQNTTAVKTEEIVPNIYEQVSFPTSLHQAQQPSSCSMQQQLPSSISNVVFSVTQPVNTSLAMANQPGQIFSLPASQQTQQASTIVHQTESSFSAGTTAPQQASTPVQEMATDSHTSVAAVPATQQWTAQVVGAAPNIVFNHQNLTPQTSALGMGTVFSVPLQQGMQAQTVVSASGIATSNLDQVNASSMQPVNVSMQQVSADQWSASQQMQNRNVNTITVPSAGVTTSQQAGMMQWQSAPQQTDKSMPDSFRNDTGSVAEQLQNSSSGEFVFRRGSGQVGAGDQTQQQIQQVQQQQAQQQQQQQQQVHQQMFTIGNAMEILDQPKASISATSSVLQQENGSFANIMLLPNNTTDVAVENGSPADTLSPSTAMGDTGLSIGFDNNFSLHDNEILVSPKVMDNSVLQSIISDCTNNSLVNADESASHVQLDQSHLFQQKLQTSLSQPTLIQDSQAHIAATPNSIAAQKDINRTNPSGQVTNHFMPSDIEMVPAPQAEDKHFDGSSQDLEDLLRHSSSVVDTNIFLVNPNCVQPMVQQPQEQSIGVSIANTATLPVSNLEPSILNQQVNAINPTASMEQPQTNNAFHTIDSSVLSLSGGNSNQLDHVSHVQNTFRGFDQIPTSNEGT